MTESETLSLLMQTLQQVQQLTECIPDERRKEELSAALFYLRRVCNRHFGLNLKPNKERVNHE